MPPTTTAPVSPTPVQTPTRLTSRPKERPEERPFRRVSRGGLLLPRRTVLAGVLATMAVRPATAEAAPGDYPSTYSARY